MSCNDTLPRLDDLLDGLLSDRERERVLSHVAGCASCREELERAEELRRLTAELPASVQPPRDLWPAIVARLEGPRTSSLLLHPGTLAVAAALLLAVVAGIAYLAGRTATGVRVVEETVAGSVVRAENAGPSLAAARDEMREARDQLRAAVAARRGDLSPETLRVVEENLRVIDDAIAHITAAFQDDPGNAELTRLLVAAYRQQINLLQRVVRLPAAA